MLFMRRLVTIAVATLLVVLTSYSPSEQAQLRARITEAGQTAIVEEEDVAQTQIAQFKETTEARIATAADKKTVLTSNRFQTTITPPYDACVGESIQILSSPPAGSNEILEKGFGSASYSCDAERGAINNTIVLFGGKDGNILKPPNYNADVSSGMEFGFTPSSTGDLRVDVTMTVNANTGAAAGSATALLDLRDAILEFLLPTQIGAFIDIAESLIFQTAAGVKTEAYIYVDTETSRDETTALVGGRGFGASFPIPPNSQSAEFNSETVMISLTTPVAQGEKIYIGTGISTTARVHGWAVAYWNPGEKQETFVVSVALTEESPSSNDSTVISNPDFKVLRPGQSDEIVFDIQNTGNTTWTFQQGYTLININNESRDERFVGVPEEGGRNLISTDPLAPGSVYTTSVDDQGKVGLYRLEVGCSPGTGKLRIAGGVDRTMKESIQRAFAYLQGHKVAMGIAQLFDTTDFHVEAIDLLTNRVSCDAGVALVVSIYSALKKHSPLPGLLILGDLSIQGNIKAVRSLVEPLQMGMENGARRALIPIENKRHFLDVSADIVERVDPVFYGDPLTAAMKGLGMN